MISTEDRLELVEKSLAKQKRATLILGCFLVAAISWGGAVEAKRAESMAIESWPSFDKLKGEVGITQGKDLLGNKEPIVVRIVDQRGRDIEFK